MFSLPDDFYMSVLSFESSNFWAHPAHPFILGDTRPTSLAGLLQDLSLAGNVRDFACANFARQGPFGIPHAFGGKKKVRPEAFVCMQTVVEKTRE